MTELSTINQKISDGIKRGGALDNKESLGQMVTNSTEWQGIADRLQKRLDDMADVSRDHDKRIDARTFTDEFTKANIELIQQMNEAGMMVFIDNVGNIHGLLADRRTQAELLSHSKTIKEVASKALGFQSHIDTVHDAGKYDGRLGVMSGVEMAHIIKDLRDNGHDVEIDGQLKHRPLMVSAFVDEEMTFTKEGVSMPGSSSVAGQQIMPDIHAMKHPDNSTYKEGLVKLLKALAEKQADGQITLYSNLNRLSNFTPGFLPAAQDFLPAMTYERHPEQAEILTHAEKPYGRVGTIVGNIQTDYTFSGDRAEEAALEFNRQCREIQTSEPGQFGDTRVTAGVFHTEGKAKTQSLNLSANYELIGEKNHAGTTEMPFRFDPGVAAGKLAQKFRELAKNHDVEPVTGNIKYLNNAKGDPTTGRNVIPGAANITLGIKGEKANADAWETIQGELTKALKDMVHDQGISNEHDLRHYHNLPSAEILTHPTVQTSLDVRDKDQKNINDYMERVSQKLDQIKQDYNVTVTAEPGQIREPIQLNKNTVLTFDASENGSHNPDELVRPDILADGTRLQLATTLQMLRSHEKPISEVVDDFMEDRGRMNMVSGAGHDTAQTVLGMNQRQQKSMVHQGTLGTSPEISTNTRQ